MQIVQATAVVISLLLTSVQALAQSSSDEEARSHFLSGEAYFGRADYARALEAFQMSFEMSQRPQLQYNIALCHERLTQLPEAIVSFEAYLAWQSESDNETISRDALEARVATLRQRIAAASSEPGLDATPQQTSRLLVPSIVALSVGAVGALTFGVMGGLTLRENDQLSDCKATRTCESDDLDSLRRFRRLADVGLAIGVAGIAVGVTLLVLHLGRSRNTEDAMVLVPVVGPTMAGASGLVRF